MIAADKYMLAPIVSRRDHTHNLWSIRIKPPETLPFRPGQYVAFGLENDSKVLERAFSIVSSPLESELEFFIEAVPEGALSPQLHKLQVGDSVYMRRKPKGIFNLDTKSGHTHHFLICTVTGVAPYVSYVRTLLRELDEGRMQQAPRFVLLQGAARSDEFAYHDELKEYSEKHGWLTYIPTISRHWEDPEWPGERGRVDDLVRKYSDNLGLEIRFTTAYLCGNPGMIVNARGILRRAGFEASFIKEETYWAPGEGEVEY
jgi:ferredoxin/flavodoxin---NADP+ reductase